MKYRKKVLLAALAASLLLACLPCTALAVNEDYSILSDDVRIVVSEDNIASITETLVIDYKQPRHGIYYNVQYKGKGRYYVGNEWCMVPYNQRVYNFDVQGYEFELSDENHDDGSATLVAKIGSADKTLTGQQTYVITYQCDLGEDSSEGFDEFYRNIISCADGYTIENATFTIELPKDVDESMVEVTMGHFTKNSSDVAWEMDGDVITGHALRPMEGGEYITLRVTMPDGYFEPKFTDLPEGILAWLILFAGL